MICNQAGAAGEGRASIKAGSQPAAPRTLPPPCPPHAHGTRRMMSRQSTASTASSTSAVVNCAARLAGSFTADSRPASAEAARSSAPPPPPRARRRAGCGRAIADVAGLAFRCLYTGQAARGGAQGRAEQAVPDSCFTGRARKRSCNGQPCRSQRRWEIGHFTQLFCCVCCLLCTCCVLRQPEKVRCAIASLCSCSHRYHNYRFALH